MARSLPANRSALRSLGGLLKLGALDINGTVHGPLAEGTARSLAAEHVAAGRQVIVWRAGWSLWVRPAQVWPGPDPGTTVRAPRGLSWPARR